MINLIFGPRFCITKPTFTFSLLTFNCVPKSTATPKALSSSIFCWMNLRFKPSPVLSPTILLYVSVVAKSYALKLSESLSRLSPLLSISPIDRYTTLIPIVSLFTANCSLLTDFIG
ncbi:hypothetical protein DRJ17_07210 [Candidatus Woesearchaeota archaeon]|nr:MAG: hypothetical protein DRJ17_07210 [Candidatus Woesearchaeota archaeon]